MRRIALLSGDGIVSIDEWMNNLIPVYSLSTLLSGGIESLLVKV